MSKAQTCSGTHTLERKAMIVLKGAEVSAKIKEEVRAALDFMSGSIPKLAILRVGENPDDISYERGAKKKLTDFGLAVQSHVWPADVTDEQFRQEFDAINRDPETDGILLLRPLPRHIRERDIERMIDPAKDLDGISPLNMAKVFSGDPSGFAPCTAEAVIEILKTNGIPIAGRRVTVVGRSLVVGRPLAMLMLAEHATVTICHTKTADLKAACKNAEILAAAAGSAGMITGDMISPGAVVIDVGINVNADGKLCGDAAFDTLEGIASMATPVPGGVGAVTTAVLAKHLVKAAAARRGIRLPERA